MEFSHKGKNYRWEYSGEDLIKDNPKIIYERLLDLDNDNRELIVRKDEQLIFNNEKVPKLSSKTSAINLFKEEESIARSI